MTLIGVIGHSLLRIYILQPFFFFWGFHRVAFSTLSENLVLWIYITLTTSTYKTSVHATLRWYTLHRLARSSWVLCGLHSLPSSVGSETHGAFSIKASTCLCGAAGSSLPAERFRSLLFHWSARFLESWGFTPCRVEPFIRLNVVSVPVILLKREMWIQKAFLEGLLYPHVFFHSLPLSLIVSLDPQSLEEGRQLDPGFSMPFACFQHLAGESLPLTSEATEWTHRLLTFLLSPACLCGYAVVCLPAVQWYEFDFFSCWAIWSLLISIRMCSIAIFEVSMGIAFYTLKWKPCEVNLYQPDAKYIQNPGSCTVPVCPA